MKLRALELRPLTIPFRMPVRHAAAERCETESVWVEARSDRGVGYGEGCPRGYVTGEDLASARRFVDRHRSVLIREVACPASLAAFARERARTIDANPAAWCALELALLDLLAKESGRSVEAELGVSELEGEFHYTAVIPDCGPTAFRALFGAYRRLGFRDFKLKISGELERDRDKLSVLGGIAGLRVRVDANNLFDDAATAADHLESLGHPLFAVEEPLAVGRYAELAGLARRLRTRVILDESFLRVDQLDRLEGPPELWILNLRVSKLGGLLRSLEAVREARRRGLPVIVGAQVGETSLLTRAGLTVAHCAHDILVAQEGAFGTRLLERDPCDPSLELGVAGRLEAPPRAPGLGLEVRR